MKIFKENNYSNKLEALRDLILLHKAATATTALGAVNLGISSSNAVNNYKARKESNKDRKELIKALDRLTKTLDKVDNTLEKDKTSNKNSDKSENKIDILEKMKKTIFRLKNNSEFVNGLSKGAALGATLGGTLMGAAKATDFMRTNFAKNNLPKFKGSDLVLIGGGTTLIGAALGAFIGGILDAYNYFNRNTANNNRLTPQIIENLKNSGFKKDQDYTLDPKMANYMKTKVCVSVTRSNGDLKIIVNSVNDPKLNQATKHILGNLPKTYATQEKVGDKFNELSITTLSDKNLDPAVVSTLLEQFIRNGYSVYIVEVG